MSDQDSIKRLASAIYQEERACLQAIERLREVASAETENEVYDLTVTLKKAVVLCGCLRRMVEERAPMEVHRSFGAPGDFGYESSIGSALASVYGLR